MTYFDSKQQHSFGHPTFLRAVGTYYAFTCIWLIIYITSARVVSVLTNGGLSDLIVFNRCLIRIGSTGEVASLQPSRRTIYIELFAEYGHNNELCFRDCGSTDSTRVLQFPACIWLWQRRVPRR